MKVTIISCTIVIFGFIACHKTLVPNENLSALHDRFHGKYKVISSTSSEAIDVNLDGTASMDILTEIPDLINANLEIRIYEKDTPLFIQFLPEQYFGYPAEPITYDTTVAINYAKQGIIRLLKFDTDIKKKILHPDQAPLPDSVHFPFPKSVTIEFDDRIKVISAKRLLTHFGWKKVEITTVYERFTKET